MSCTFVRVSLIEMETDAEGAEHGGKSRLYCMSKLVLLSKAEATASLGSNPLFIRCPHRAGRSGGAEIQKYASCHKLLVLTGRFSTAAGELADW
jgi:hypothetical protein